MYIVNRFARTSIRRAFLMCQLALLSIWGTATPLYVWSQSAPAKAAPADKNPDGTSALGFSIESEMLTYRALESNSEAVACDVNAYLNGGSADFKSPPAGQVCGVNDGTTSTASTASIVMVPFDGSAFSDFLRWRADMETMKELRTRADPYCPTSTVLQTNERGAAASHGVDLTPAGSAVTMAQTILGMVASQVETSPVGGTITDQAFMDGVAGQLRSLKVPVVMPTAFVPYLLTTRDASRSPFLSSLDKLLKAHICLDAKQARREAEDQARREAKDQARSDANGQARSDANDQAKSDANDSVAKLIADIDAYLASLSGSMAAKTVTPAPSGTAPAASAAPGGTTPPAAGAPLPSHLMAVLSADGLAQKLGVDPATGLLPDNGASQHILLIKALESGGAIEKSGSILNTKIRYSGGSVGTYALFTMDGELECSGNVYDYGGSIPAKKFEDHLHAQKFDPSKQFIFLRGGCHVPVRR
jgi:hypothetical protein